MELNWELCRIFYQVARCRNFSRAAAMLFTSQPAVSRSMAALERELGCRLFIRNRRGVELTPEGRVFYAHVEAGCEQFRRGREELEQAVLPHQNTFVLRQERDGLLLVHPFHLIINILKVIVEGLPVDAAALRNLPN